MSTRPENVVESDMSPDALSLPDALSVEVCIMTQGDRPEELQRAVRSAQAAGFSSIRVLWNGVQPSTDLDGVVNEESATNLGIPGGRDALAQHSAADILFYLDDDAEIRLLSPERLVGRFANDANLAAVSCRIIDEQGASRREYVPVAGAANPSVSRRCATFLGGASAIRHRALDEVGGFWPELFYGHEETDLSWRFYDAGYHVEYDADFVVFHPGGDISRHERGWELTGRNRVMIARRDLPWPVALAHVSTWLLLGAYRAPTGATKRAYLRGWRDGWRTSVRRRPISWSTVRRLGQSGRLPVT